MTELTQLQKIKLLLGIASNDKDILLGLLIDQAEEFCINYTQQDIDNIPESIVDQIVVYRYNLLGTEGLNSESYSGMSFNYNQDLQDHIYKQLNRLRKVIFK